MRRHEMLLCFIAVAALACASPTSRSIVPTPTPSEDSAREQTADQQVRHVLNRLAFGPRPGDYERVRAMGVDAWIAQQLEPQKIDDHAMDTLLAHFSTLALSPAELIRDYPPPALIKRKDVIARRAGKRRGVDSTADTSLSPADSMAVRRARRQSQRVIAELDAAKMARAVASNRQLEEVMVDFWENHFNVFAGKGPERYYLASYERDAIRPYALGHFRDLLEAVAKSPAMLYYLDNWESSADSGRPVLGTRDSRLGTRRLRTARRFSFPRGVTNPGSRVPSPQSRASRRGINENYGRELMELHTLGVNGGYTQQDVINVARAFTGWTLQAPRQGGGFVFRPQMHDAGTKVVLGDTLPAGRGMEDGEQ